MTRRMLISSYLISTALCRPVSPMTLMPYPVASEWTQILNHAQLALQLAMQSRILQSNLQVAALAKIQGRLLSSQQWAHTLRDLYDLAQNVRQGQGLAYTMGNLDRVFRQAYPGYLKNGVDFNVQYDDWNRTTQDTIAGALRSLNIHADQLTSDQQFMGTIRNFARSAEGETQVLQAGVMVANMQVDRLDKIRQLMMTQIAQTGAALGRQVQIDQAQSEILKKSIGHGHYVPKN
jgi:P-type conjugative transfer protein TrbJ